MSLLLAGLILLAALAWTWLIVMVFGFEHQSVVRAHDDVVDAYRAMVNGDILEARMKLAGVTGSLEGTFFHYPWTRPRRNMQRAIWHPGEAQLG